MPEIASAIRDSSPPGLQRKVRVGLLLDSFDAPAWVLTMLERVLATGDVEISLVVRNAAPAEPRPSFLRRLLRNWRHFLYIAYRKLDERFLRPKPNAFAKQSLVTVLAGVPVLDVQPKRTKFSDYISDEDLAQIAKSDLDVLVRLGFRILRGKILQAARCGVWSFHHGDPDLYRGGPAGMWEVLNNQATTGSVLQILNEDLDGGLVLSRTQSTTDTMSVTRSLNNHCWKTLSFLPRQLTQLRRQGPEKFLQAAQAAQPTVNMYSHRMYVAPRNSQMVRPLLRLIARMAHRRWIHIAYGNYWFLLARPSESLHGSLHRFQEIKPPRDRFWADPNIVEHQGRAYVFCEEYLNAEQRGVISLFEIDAEGRWPERPTVVLNRPYHLSYPFVFEYQGQRHMLVESSSEKRVEVYPCLEFPHRWGEPVTLMDNVRAVDATLFEQDGRWWMFANMVENQGAKPWDELFLFHADSPLSKNWTPHPKNPIVSDVHTARPAGPLFSHEGRLIRPSQICDRGYGRGVSFNHVTKLSETEYEEQPIGQIVPDWADDVRATHSFTRGGGWTVCDANRIYRRFF